MGLIKAGIGAIGGTLADQWKEFFYCESINNDVLMVKGEKKILKRSSNTKGNDNIISNGSGIAVADGQCMIIVEQGKIVEVCAEPGEYTYDTSTEASIFVGPLSQSIKDTFKTMVKRLTYGGDTAKDQRVYYFNIKEILDNKYGTVNPIPFRVVDKNIGLDIDISVKCHGTFSYKIVDPLLFYTHVSGNVKECYYKEDIAGMLKGELLTALQPAFANVSEAGIRYSSLPGHTTEIVEELNKILDQKWSQLRGIEMTSLTILSITANKEDEALIKNVQKTALLTNPSMAAATLVEAQSEALKAAASNDGGTMLGFMGMNMVQGATGLNAQSLYEMPKKEIEKESKDIWVCQCGAKNTGKFCMDCGKEKPKVKGWICECGTVNKGKYCTECGKKKPDDKYIYRCDKCGWEPENPYDPPKFCPECGDIFDDDDKK